MQTSSSHQEHSKMKSMQQEAQKPVLVIGGTSSGVGKTSISVGLMAALRDQGLTVQAFKVGPDFIDPLHHESATGRPSINLDGWMLNQEQVLATFQRHMIDADIAIVEGVMGLFDGRDGTTEAGSTAQIAKWLNAPVILILDCSAVARSAAALVKGYQEFDPGLHLGGILFNKVGGDAHTKWLTDAINSSGLDGISVLGGIPKENSVTIHERYLGLHLPHDRSMSPDLIHNLAALVRKHVDIDALIALAESRCVNNNVVPLCIDEISREDVEQKSAIIDTSSNRNDVPFSSSKKKGKKKNKNKAKKKESTSASQQQPTTTTTTTTIQATKDIDNDTDDAADFVASTSIEAEILIDNNDITTSNTTTSNTTTNTTTTMAPPPQKIVRIAVARDAAFCFYYHDNLTLLVEAGAELVYFSPLVDPLPLHISGIYIGGGYPELYAVELAENKLCRAGLKAFAGAGGVIYAECGGLLLLSQSIQPHGEPPQPMAGVYPFKTILPPNKYTMGYVEIETTPECPLFPPGVTARGHVHHSSELVEEHHIGGVVSNSSLDNNDGAAVSSTSFVIDATHTSGFSVSPHDDNGQEKKEDDEHIKEEDKVEEEEEGNKVEAEQSKKKDGIVDSLYPTNPTLPTTTTTTSAPPHWTSGYIARPQIPGAAPAPEGFSIRNVLGSYIHLHFGGCPQLATALVEHCRRVDVDEVSHAVAVSASTAAMLEGSCIQATPPGSLVHQQINPTPGLLTVRSTPDFHQAPYSARSRSVDFGPRYGGGSSSLHYANLATQQKLQHHSPSTTISKNVSSCSLSSYGAPLHSSHPTMNAPPPSQQQQQLQVQGMHPHHHHPAAMNTSTSNTTALLLNHQQQQHQGAGGSSSFYDPYTYHQHHNNQTQGHHLHTERASLRSESPLQLSPRTAVSLDGYHALHAEQMHQYEHTYNQYNQHHTNPLASQYPYHSQQQQHPGGRQQQQHASASSLYHPGYIPTSSNPEDAPGMQMPPSYAASMLPHQYQQEREPLHRSSSEHHIHRMPPLPLHQLNASNAGAALNTSTSTASAGTTATINPMLNRHRINSAVPQHQSMIQDYHHVRGSSHSKTPLHHMNDDDNNNNDDDSCMVVPETPFDAHTTNTTSTAHGGDVNAKTPTTRLIPGALDLSGLSREDTPRLHFASSGSATPHNWQHSYPPSDKIVTLGPGATEILWALGLGSRVVAVSDLCDYPPDASTRAKIARTMPPPPPLLLGGGGGVGGSGSAGTSASQSPVKTMNGYAHTSERNIRNSSSGNALQSMHASLLAASSSTSGNNSGHNSGHGLMHSSRGGSSGGLSAVEVAALATAAAGGSGYSSSIPAPNSSTMPAPIPLKIDEQVLARERPGLLVFEDDDGLPANAKSDDLDHGPLGRLIVQAVVAVGLQQTCRIVCLHRTTLNDVLSSMLTVGEAAGVGDEAAKAVDRLRARLRRVAGEAARATMMLGSTANNGGNGNGNTSARLPQHGAAAFTENTNMPTSYNDIHAKNTLGVTGAMGRPRVLILRSLQPLLVEGLWAPDMITLAGGEPGSIQPGDPPRAMKWDDIVQFSPEVLVIAGMHDGNCTRIFHDLCSIAALPGWWLLPAVRAGAVFVCEEALTRRAGPRLVDGVESLARMVHGDAMSVCCPPRAVLKLSLRPGQRCRPRLLPNYFMAYC